MFQIRFERGLAKANIHHQIATKKFLSRKFFRRLGEVDVLNVQPSRNIENIASIPHFTFYLI